MTQELLLKIRANYYEQFNANFKLDVPAEGYGGWKSAEVAVASRGPEIEPCQPEQKQHDYRSGDNRRRPACSGWQGGGCPLGKEATGSELRLAQ